jgi:hypothetical protein
MGLALGRKPGQIEVAGAENREGQSTMNTAELLENKVNEAFASARERFGTKRKDGARTMKGRGRGAKGLLWSMRDLRVGSLS